MTSGPAQVFIRELLISRVRTADVFYMNGKGLMCTSQETEEVPPYRMSSSLELVRVCVSLLGCAVPD